MQSTTAVEVSASSSTGFEDAINRGLHQACAGIHSLRHLSSAHVEDQQMLVESGRSSVYRVKMQVTFVHEREN